MRQCARICLIDDDIYLRDALALALREHGFDVKLAPGAVAGLDLLEREHIDAVVTDMSMPGTSGVQLIAEARTRWPAMPIIAISGVSHVDGVSVIDSARVLGANALLAKPFRVAELIALLEEALNPAAPHGDGVRN